jgi:hypothetical protein
MQWCHQCDHETRHEYTHHGWIKCKACGFVGGFLTRDGISIDELREETSSDDHRRSTR